MIIGIDYVIDHMMMIDITLIDGMIFGVMIRKIIKEMSIGAMTDMIHKEMRIGRTTTEVMVGIIMTEITHPNEIILLTNSHTGKIVIKKIAKLIALADKMIIAKEISTKKISAISACFSREGKFLSPRH